MVKKIFFLFFFLSLSVNFLRAQILVASGGPATYTISPYPGNFTAYYDGFSVIFRATVANTGPATMNIAGAGPINIANTAGNSLVANDILVNQVVMLVYDASGTRFQMVTTSGNVGGGGAITGGGTASYLSRWATASTLTTSVMFDDGTNVGIGTATPGHKLDVSGTGTVYGRIISTTSAAANEGGLLLSRGDLANGYAQAHFLTGTTFHWSTGLRLGDNNFHFWNATDGADRMIIQAGTGNVGIGITAPTSLLHVVSPNVLNLTSPMVTLTNNEINNGESQGLLIRAGNGTSDFPLRVQSRAGTDFFVVTGNGGVGIGTTGPVSKLDVEGAAVIGAAYSGTNAAPANGLLVEGNVGVGLTSPLAKLHVAANSQNGIVTQVSSAGNFPYHVFYRSRGTIGAETAVFNNDILGGIIFMSHNGTSPGDAAYLRAKATENHGGGRGTELQFHTTANTIATPSVKMVIANDGNVGIGTGVNAPLQKLTVDGNFGILETGTSPVFHSIFQGGDQADDLVYTLPPSHGPGGTVILQNNGSGILNWVTAAGGGIAGSGTLNYVPKFTPDGTTLGSSQIFDDGTNVGIGTNAPSSFLHVQGNSDLVSPRQIVISRAANTNDKLRIGFLNSGSIYGAIQAVTEGTAFRNLILNPEGGNVGIGAVTAPMNKLDVEGGAVIGATYSGTNTAPANGLLVQGNLGVGTPSPATSLHINATDALIVPNGTTAQRPGTPAAGMFRYNNSIAGLEYYNGAWTTVAPAPWLTSGSDIYYNSGKVGIGTVPTGDLHVFRSTGSSKIIVESDGSGVSDAPEIILDANTTNVGAIALTFKENGVFKASTGWSTTAAQQWWFVYDGGTAESLIFKAGKFGVGTQSPTTKLHVNGDISLSQLTFISPGTTYNAFPTSNKSYIRIDVTNNTVLNGITPPASPDGKILILHFNVPNTRNITVNHLNGGALGSDQLYNTGTVAAISFTGTASSNVLVLTYIYSSADARWVLIAKQ